MCSQLWCIYLESCAELDRLKGLNQIVSNQWRGSEAVTTGEKRERGKNHVAENNQSDCSDSIDEIRVEHESLLARNNLASEIFLNVDQYATDLVLK